MSQYTIYHNPRCRKSREALELMQHSCKDLKIIDYLKTPPDEKEIKSVLKKLGIKPIELIRKGETVFKEKYQHKDLSDDQWIKVMAENPILIERPIVIMGDKAVIGRPPENVLSLL